jgi:DNA-directed RNA polymerase I subunit RPA2
MATATITELPRSFDPLAPNATPSSSKHTFHTLERERLNRHPSTTGADHPSLEELVKPHIQSFNALMETSDGKGKGLLQLGVEDLGSKVVFDGKGEAGVGGNKLSCKCHPVNMELRVWLNRCLSDCRPDHSGYAQQAHDSG